MKKIAVLEGNSALQRTLFFDRFNPGAVNRAQKMTFSAGGKGANFCRALLATGDVCGVLLHFSGGENGKKADSFLEKEGIRVISTMVEKETRCCTTCLDPHSDSMTELIEPSFPPAEAEKSAFLAALEEFLLNEEVAGCAITGSLPDGTDPVTYYQWAEKVLACGKPLLMDIVKGVGKILPLPGKKILKINREELARLTGEEDLFKGMEALLHSTSLYALGITDGPGRAFLGAEGKIWSFAIPQLSHVASPLGCGDSVSAFFFRGILAGEAPEKAFAAALGAGCANCLTPEPAVFSMEEALRFGKDVKITVVK